MNTYEYNLNDSTIVLAVFVASSRVYTIEFRDAPRTNIGQVE
jgi:hypothetical protein